MDINVKSQPEATVVKLVGDIDGSTAPAAQQAIMPLIQPGCKIVLDMTEVPFMSSAGLRMLLVVYRQSAASGHVVLVGLSDEIKETMEMTGFLEFFQLADTIDEGIAAVNA